jgi:glycosyltransferase involved in cell wall biosynthesis
MKKSVVSIVLNDFTHDSRVLKECVSLKDAGYSVRVAAMHSVGLAEREIVNEIDVRRYPISLQRLSNGLFFSSLKYLQLLWRIYRDNRNIDIYHCNDIEALPIGVFAKWMGRNKRVVYDAHEYESEKSGVWGFRKKLIFIFERFFIKYADSTITVGDKIAEEYARIYKITKPTVVMNCPILVEKDYNRSLLRKQFSIDNDRIILMVQGTLTPDRGIQETLDAFVKVNRKDMALIFMGYGSMEEQIKKFASKYENIFFMPSVAPDVVVNYTASADVGLTFIENNSLSYYYSLPNKFFEYIHADLAIVSWPLSEIKKIVEENNIGIITQDFTSEAIQTILEKLNKEEINIYKSNMNNLKYKFNWQQQELVLVSVYKDLYN